MDISYKNKKIKRICTDASIAVKEYGVEMAEKIHQRIDEISSADNMNCLVKYHIGNCHQLRGDRKNQYAMDLIQPYRLIIINNKKSIQIALIYEIIDYH